MTSVGQVVLIVGANRGLGLELTNALVQRGLTVYATCRNSNDALQAAKPAKIVTGIDLEADDCGEKLVKELGSVTFDTVFVVAGYFTTETFEQLNWNENRKMIDICALGPLKIVNPLVLANKLKEGSKVAIITSEAGSIALRVEQEGGGNYGHHMSKAAANMMGRLLAWDLKPRGISVVMMHPGFMRTEMTARYAQYYDALGAVTPAESIDPILRVVSDLSLETTGRFVAAQGSQGLNPNAKAVLADPSAVPTELPW
ncbi:hypothetical protein HK102_012239 [Quaeritorhiza haematococci]|nr:hypothetical protein HK102_012239 [Quaeritorhiza haematococci]